jgi:uncharacterized protein YigA (DUF484 family)
MANSGPAAQALTGDALRDKLLADPGLVLDDPEVMAMLMAASERAMGANIIDMRGLAMERLQARHDRLEETHRAVVAAAYDNLASTNQVHRAILSLLDHSAFDAFLEALEGDVSAILRVDSARLVLETAQKADEGALRRLGQVLMLAEPGYVAHYMNGGRTPTSRQVVLRQCDGASERMHADRAGDTRSEVMMRLDLGAGRLPGMLVMGSEDPHQFKPGQGTDLLSFFIGVFERQMRRFLS